MATLPPASSAGMAEASRATWPVAASKTLTSCPFTSSLSSGEEALIGRMEASVSRARREPSGERTISGQTGATEVRSYHSRRPSVDMATSPPAPAPTQAVTKTSCSETKS